MKSLVTGGAGFIGSNCVDALIDKGHEVIIIDNLSTGKKENINSKAKFIEADITNLEEIKPHFEGVDYVFHFAALPRVQVSIEDPISTHNININGTLNVLLAARDAKVKRLVYSASSSAYGDNDQMPLQEDFLPAPMSPYGLHKYVGEHYARLFSLLYGLETVSLRYFNAYGPRMAFEGSYFTVVATFLLQKKQGKILTIVGDGNQTRDFTYVGDIVNANIAAATSTKVGKGEVINIGAGKNYSVNEIAKRIGGETTNIDPRIEPKDTLADNTKAKELLDWQPEVDLDEGLKNSIDWFDSVDYIN
ncbi:MAG: LPS biosynthesis protein WbpP [Parcubacteria group bacterium]|nr:LPS biosynthesis protein WbpP [Parcubacteria group bacterium]|tara:strand:+ start:5008 stop:5922 length:915 start_codon:yes stop_codon:yes gene_type:complete